MAAVRSHMEIEDEKIEQVIDERDDLKRIAPWRQQITIRGLITSLVIGIMYSVIVMKLALTTGLIPNLNVSAALVAFVFVKTWTSLLHKAGFVSAPFTRQENTVIQTCATACYTIAFSGAVLSWGIMWPLISDLKGTWFPKNIPESSMKSLNGYKVFIAIALILGDGLYNFVKVVYISSLNMYAKMKQKNLRTIHDDAVQDEQTQSAEDLKQNELFVRERIPIWIAFLGYIAFSIVSIIVIPLMFKEVKWYYVVVAYLLAPALGFCNAYGAGLTDLNMGYNYGKVALFIIAAIAGNDSGVVAGLVACGLIKAIVSICADLMHDFKTGHLTLTSPKSMLVSQAIGTAMGCIIAPLTFLLFYKAFDIGNPDGEYKAPYALIYRNMAIIGVQGFSALPQHCLQLCYGFFAFAVASNLVRDFSPKSVAKCIPLPIAMAVPFLVGAYFAIDMCVGSLVVFVWTKMDKAKAKLMVPAVASGLICGDGMWLLPSSVLALAKISSPICMTFLASKASSSGY
ncbi:hypothetical protein QQ045_030763 [Rhodiola kirilowii]